MWPSLVEASLNNMFRRPVAAISPKLLALTSHHQARMVLSPKLLHFLLPMALFPVYCERRSSTIGRLIDTGARNAQPWLLTALLLHLRLLSDAMKPLRGSDFLPMRAIKVHNWLPTI